MKLIEARVTVVDTLLTPVGVGAREELELKHWRRLMLERVPFTGEARAAVAVDHPVQYGEIAENVEAWATRRMHAEGTYMDKETMARRWYEEEYRPVVELIEEAGVRGSHERPTEAYLRVACERYTLIRDHEWSAEIVEQVRKGKGRKR